ncbi:MAG: DUF2167 domain-containing protein [Methylocystis sp.]
MSLFRSRCRLLAGLGALLASCCLSVRPAEARAHRSIIVDIAPLQPLEGLPTRAAGPERKAGGEQALADPGPATAPTGETPRIESASAEVLPSGHPFEKATEPAGNGSMVLVPSATTHWSYPPTPGQAPAERLSLDLDVKQGLALVEMQAPTPDATDGQKDLASTGTSSSSLLIAGELGAAPLAAILPTRASPRDSASQAVAEPGGVVASTPSPIALYGEARRSKRSPTLSAFAKDVQLISNVIPPMQPSKLPLGEGDAALSNVPKAWEPRGVSLQLPMVWLSQPSRERAAPSAAEPDIGASQPSVEGDHRSARTAEQERKSQLWRPLAQTRSAGKLERPLPDSSGQSKFLRTIKQFVGGAPETPAEQAYAALLEEGVRGPTRLRIGDRATLWLPFGYVFLDAEKARELLLGEEGALDEGNFGVILPSTRAPTWMAYVDLIDQGHIKEDDAKALTFPTLLVGLATATAAQNVERGRNGLAPLTVGDWIEAPSICRPNTA